MKKNYMETTDNSYKSLITFAHTGKRGTNLSDTPIRNATLKKLYKEFFTLLVNWKFPVHNNKFIKNFCGEWVKFNNKFKTTFEKKFSKLVDTDEQCFNCWLKFNGNCGEIFAEWYFRYGDCSIIEQSTYTTVDPNNENFTDASAESSEDSYPIGIQIKNWVNEISFDVFEKASAQITQTGMQMKIQDPNFDWNSFMKPDSCRQIVFSMTNRIWNKAMDVNGWLKTGLIEFIGPEQIDKYLLSFTKDKFKKQVTDKIIKKL